MSLKFLVLSKQHIVVWNDFTTVSRLIFHGDEPDKQKCFVIYAACV